MEERVMTKVMNMERVIKILVRVFMVSLKKNENFDVLLSNKHTMI